MAQKTPLQAITDLGIDEGFIYVVDKATNAIKFILKNDKNGVDTARGLAFSDTPFSQGTRSVGKLQIDARTGTGTVTAVNVGAANQISAAVTHTGLTTTQLATNLTTAINTYDAGSGDFTAKSSANVITLLAKVPGSSLNGLLPSLTVSAGTVDSVGTVTSGGFASSDSSLYNNYFLDANYDANSTVCGGTASTTTVGANAINITSVFVPVTNSGGTKSSISTIDSAGKATIVRVSNFQYVEIAANAGVADDLTDIDTEGITDQDFVVLVRDSSDTITVKSTGNISLAGGPADMVLDQNYKSIILRYDLTSNTWIEVVRTSILTITDASLRANNISVGKSGSTVYTILPAGGTTTLVPGTAAKDIVWNGNSVTLVGSAVLTFGGTPIDGEPFYIHYLPVADVGGNTVTIGGIVLTEDQAETGVAAIAFYDNANTTWRVRLLVDGATEFVRNEKIPNSEIQSAKLANTAVAAGSYTLASVTFNAQGQATSASSGTVTGGTALANTLWVDLNGDDSTAIKGDIGKPYQSYAAAKTVASSGELIVLMPGTYNANDILKDGVNVHFMQGASIVYTGAGDPIMKDSLAVAFNCVFSGYPNFRYNGSGTNRQSLYLTGTGTVNLTFKDAYFYGSLQKTILINNANASVTFNNCIFEQDVIDAMVIDIDTFTKVYFDNCQVINRNNAAASHGLSINADNVILDKMGIYIQHATADSINATAAIDLKLYNFASTNKATGGSAITYLMGTYSLVVDTDFTL